MKRLLIVGLLLLVFGCVNPDPPPEHPLFGYVGTAISDLGTGNYIAELSTSSNIATISSEDPENTDYIIDLILEAQDYGTQSIIWVDRLFFHIENWGTPEQELYLYPDWQERWDRYASGLAPYMDSVLMFYVLDEPFWNGLKVGISQPDMLVMIETVAATIKNTFPDVHIGSCFASPSVNSSLQIPADYTMVGFCYYQRGQNVETYIEMYLAYLDVFRSAMHPHQKLFLVPGAYQNADNIPSQDDLIFTADFFYNLFLSEKAEMMIAFLYPSVPPGLIGLEELPELMTKYEEIGALIIDK